MLRGEDTYRLPFTGVNLERDDVERLPQPYRFLSKILDGMMADINDRILEIEKRKREAIHEYALPRIECTGRIEIGKVTCVAQNNVGLYDGSSDSSNVVACGTADGEVLLLDISKTGRLVCSTMVGAPPPPPPYESRLIEILNTTILTLDLLK